MSEETRARWSDRRVEQIVGDLLRIGVILAAIVTLVGGVFYVIHHGAAPADHRIFRGEPADLRSVSGIFHDMLTLNDSGIIEVGLLILIATPIARVAFTVVAFALQRDRVYIGITLVVLAILLYSLVGPHP